MTTILHLSDTHFGTQQPAVMSALLAVARGEAPDVAIVSGDVTQRARRAQFAAARAFVDALGARDTLVIPGNHDIPLFNVAARMLTPYGAYAAAFSADLEPELERSDVLVLCVNTTRPTRHKHGSVSDAQIERVARRLERASPQQLRIVVTHQPVAVTRDTERKNLLRGHVDAIRAWASAGADLVLGGHIHLPYVCRLRDHAPGLPREVWAVQAGTAVSNRTRRTAPNSVNLIRYDAVARICVVERWDYLAREGAFARVAAARIEPQR